MTAEQYHRDRIGTVLWFAQSHPWVALAMVVWFFGGLLLVASATKPRRRP